MGNFSYLNELYFDVQQIHGREYRANPIMRVYLGIITIVGSISNIIVIFTILVSPKMRTTTNIYSIQHATACLLICSIHVPTGLHYSRIPSRPQSTIVCRIVAHCAIFSMALSLASLAAIAVNRYILIFKGMAAYASLYDRKKISISFAVMWAWSLFMAVMPLTGLAVFGYNPKYSNCIFIVTDDIDSYIGVAIGVSLTGLPTAGVILYCYTTILVKFWKVKKKMNSLGPITRRGTILSTDTQIATKTPELRGGNTVSQRRNITQHNRSIKTVLSLIFMCVSHLTLWLPVIILSCFDMKGTWPAYAYLVAGNLAYGSCLTQPIIFVFVSKTHREAHRLTVTFQWNTLRNLR